MKKIIKTMLLGIFLTYGMVYSNEGKKIAYIKEKLVKAPKKQNNSLSNIPLKLLSSIGVSAALINGIITLLYVNPIKESFDPLECSKEDVESYRFSPKFILALSLFIYPFVNRFFLRAATNSNFIKFIEEWEHNKKYTPKELHYNLGKLHIAHSKKLPLGKKAIAEVIDLTKKLIAQKKGK